MNSDPYIDRSKLVLLLNDDEQIHFIGQTIDILRYLDNNGISPKVYERLRWLNEVVSVIINNEGDENE